MDFTAYAFGEFAGGLLGVVFLTALWSLVIRRFLQPPALVYVANLLSLLTATIVGGYGLANGASPNFAYSFGMYAVPQIIVFTALLWRQRASGKARPLDYAIDTQLLRTTGDTSSVPTVEIDVNEIPDRQTNHGETLHVQTKRPRRSNFFAQYWRGEFSLGASYWGVNFLVYLAILALVGTLTALFSPEDGFEPVSIFWFTSLLSAGIAAVVVWQVVGLWRAAQRHADRQRKAGKSVFWAGAAQLMAVLSVLQIVGTFSQNTAPQISEMYRIAFKDDPDLPPNELKLLSGGTELSLFGGIKYGLSRDVERLLKAAPDVSVIHLNSSGGRIAEANKLFKLIKERAIDTYVSNECSSACTLVFAAGSHRWLSDAAKLGYHGLSFPGLTEQERRAATEEWAAMYRAAGLDGTFITKALAVSQETMWYPTSDELMQAKAITDIDRGEKFGSSGHEIVPSLASIEHDMRASSEVIDALQDAAPDVAHKIYRSVRVGIMAGQSKDQLRQSVSGFVASAVFANFLRADDETLAEYATLLSKQYLSLLTRDPALCFQYAALGANADVIKALPSDIIEMEEQLNARILRAGGGRPAPKLEENQAAWAIISETMTQEQAALLAMEPGQVPAAGYDQYCKGTIAMFKGISSFGTSQAAMIMRQVFSTK
ncbi:MAG: hypothetical protein E5X51_24450 [Mesorhizobium sp.]|uniref:hypothetical protein n=1 Tax=Mesorhizobium sp. TaxID=1871066 RepID=UPI0011F5B143|nr:hypothetical protein [Mesorhizobium sp.]TIQ18743.1 MAG: hypothetical protein E5X51_24450 [Mesorhizobium sp.]